MAEIEEQFYDRPGHLAKKMFRSEATKKDFEEIKAIFEQISSGQITEKEAAARIYKLNDAVRYL